MQSDAGALEFASESLRRDRGSLRGGGWANGPGGGDKYGGAEYVSVCLCVCVCARVFLAGEVVNCSFDIFLWVSWKAGSVPFAANRTATLLELLGQKGGHVYRMWMFVWAFMTLFTGASSCVPSLNIGKQGLIVFYFLASLSPSINLRWSREDSKGMSETTYLFLFTG